MNKMNLEEPGRDLETCMDDNGRPFWNSCASPQSVKVRGDCSFPPHLPGIVIFVHGVNSTGEWYQTAEESLCAGLNIRLGLGDTEYSLRPNIYSCDSPASDNGRRRILTEGRSPVIRFYWGYRSPEGDEGKYTIPLVNINNEDYHQMIADGIPEQDIRKKGPFFWGGGPFQNGTTQLGSLWSEEGFKENLFGVFPVQLVAPDEDRLLTNAPPRKYYAHAAKRLADLMDFIRQEYPRDTISVISHSQGTMIAMAATTLAKRAPDALFILSSPYSLSNKVTDTIALPLGEDSSDNSRHQTLAAIIDKIATQSKPLPVDDYNSLCVGKTLDKKPWKPDVIFKSEKNGEDIPERDNHGRFYIYCNPHDRVMGASPLLSLGWVGLKNNPDGSPHSLMMKYKGHIFQRILARWLPCGDKPNPKTSFTPADGKPFWDDNGDLFTYNNTGYWTVNINGEEVINPIQTREMVDFDETRVGLEELPNEEYGHGWGQLSKKIHDKTGESKPVDDTFKNYINLYPYQQVLTGYEPTTYGARPVYRRETAEERAARVGKYISQPTDHSTLPNSKEFMSRVVAYDLPIGFCDASMNKAFMDQIRTMADWTQGLDPYMEKGILNIPERPAMIHTNTAAQDYKDTYPEQFERYRHENRLFGWEAGGRPVNKG
jgi:pimeloyl-ACP methyl ester carboxylesterase